MNVAVYRSSTTWRAWRVRFAIMRLLDAARATHARTGLTQYISIKIASTDPPNPIRRMISSVWGAFTDSNRLTSVETEPTNCSNSLRCINLVGNEPPEWRRSRPAVECCSETRLKRETSRKLHRQLNLVDRSPCSVT